MKMVVTGLHYGTRKFADIDKNAHLFIELRPFHWIINADVLKAQHKKHKFNDSDIKVTNIVTVKDTPQNNSIFVLAISKDDAAQDIIDSLPKKDLPMKPVLRSKNPKAPRTKTIVKRLLKMLDFAKMHLGNVLKGNKVVVWYQKNGKSKYKLETR